MDRRSFLRSAPLIVTGLIGGLSQVKPVGDGSGDSRVIKSSTELTDRIPVKGFHEAYTWIKAYELYCPPTSGPVLLLGQFEVTSENDPPVMVDSVIFKNDQILGKVNGTNVGKDEHHYRDVVFATDYNATGSTYSLRLYAARVEPNPTDVILEASCGELQCILLRGGA